MCARRFAIISVGIVLAAVSALAQPGAPEEGQGPGAEIEQLRQAVSAQQAKVADLQERLAQSQGQVAQLRQQLADRDAQLAQLRALCKQAGVKLPESGRSREPAAGAKLSAKERAYLAEAERQRVAALRAGERQLRQLAAQMTRIVQGKIKKRSPGIIIDAQTGAYTFSSAEQKGQKMRQVQERIGKLHQRLTALRTNDPPFVPALRGGFAVGKAGRFEYPVTVRQIIDKTNMVVEAAAAVSAAESDLWTVQKLSIWLSGVATDRFVDDVQVELTSPFEITGTRQYRAPTGAVKTVFVASPFDATRVNQAMRGGK